MTLSMDLNALNNFLEKKAQEHKLALYGLAPLERPLTIEFYKQWIANQYQGEMSYLETHLPQKEDPQKIQNRLQTAIVFAAPYFPTHKEQKSPIRQLRTALYSQNQDYHFWFKDILNQISNELKHLYQEEEFFCFTDSGPILERDLAQKAGLGWFGKNTCLIHPKKGSLFFIGEILTSLKIQAQTTVLPDFCGTCNRCIEICPTQAILEPHKLDARRCISYLTIESRQVPPLELREKIGDWFFGCDLCQTVCPWNQKIFKAQLETSSLIDLDQKETSSLVEDLKFILSSSGKSLQKAFHSSPLLRAGPFGLRRNALVIIGNKQLKVLKPEVLKFKDDEKLGELANWCLEKLN